MPLQLGQVVERIGVIQLAGVDQAHEQIADAGSVLGLVEQRILAVQNRFLQGPLADVVVQRSTRLTQEQSQLLPVPQHVLDGATEGRIGLCQLLVQLPFQPIVQLLHRRPALLPMPLQPRARAIAGAPGRWHRCGKPRRALRAGSGIAQENDRTRRRIAAGHGPGSGPESSAARPAGCGTVRRTSGSAAASFRSTELEHPGQILTRVLAAAKEQGHPVTVAQRDHARSEQAGALVGVGPVAIGTGLGFWPAALSHQFQDFDRGVIVVQHVALGRLPDQLRKGRSNVGGDRTHDVPLGRGRQRNLQMPLQAFEAVERQSAAVLQEPDHAAGRGIVLSVARVLRRWGGEHLAAQMATQFLQLVDRRRQRGVPRDPHHHARRFVVNGAFAAGRTGVAGR